MRDRGRLGYACLNTILRKQKPPVFCSRTCRLDTVAKEDKGVPYLRELTRQNIKDLKTLIEWNAAHNIFFMRSACFCLLTGATMSPCRRREPSQQPADLFSSSTALSVTLLPLRQHFCDFQCRPTSHPSPAIPICSTHSTTSPKN